MHSLVLLRIDPPDIPHVLGHRVQGDQKPQLPSRGPAKINQFENYETRKRLSLNKVDRYSVLVLLNVVLSWRASGALM